MQLTIQLPERSEALASNRQRWAEVLADRELERFSGRIETNAFGQIIMSPPPSFGHCTRQARISFQLQQRLGGLGMTECPVSTSDGVKATDAAWFSDQRFAEVEGQQVCEIAPEICVEVLSPRNTEAEMQHKRNLYFEAGAQECWICDLEGKMSYYLFTTPHDIVTRSALCPNFPASI